MVIHVVLCQGCASGRKGPHVQDVWGFLGELLSLELPEMAELISGMVVGSVMGDLSNLTSRKAGPNDWSLGFPMLETEISLLG